VELSRRLSAVLERNIFFKEDKEADAKNNQLPFEFVVCPANRTMPGEIGCKQP
jgi:hypothetical protein